MSTITKERVAQYANDPRMCNVNDEIRQIARIALASLEAEAVAYIIQDAQARGRGRPGFLSFDASISDEDINEYEISVTPLYTAPQLPQPAVPDEDLLHMAASAIDDLLSNKDRSGAGVWADIPAKLRRAAMLQGAGGNSPVIPDEVLSAVRKVACIRADFDGFDGDRRDIGDCLDEAEQELIVTINKYASVIAAAPQEEV